MSKTVLAELVAVFTGDTKGLDSAVERAGKSIAQFGKIAAAAAFAAGGALATLALRQIQVVGDANDMAKSLGLSYAALQDMSLVAKEAGVEIGALSSALGFMQRSVVDAASGSESAGAAFNYLGLNIKSLMELSPEQQFAAIAEKISLIENPATRTAVAMDIFGKSGRGLINIFEDYGTKAEEAAAFNDRFNLSLSQVDAQKLDDAGDAMARVGLAMTGIGNTVAIEMAPALTDLSNAFTNSSGAAKGFGTIAGVAVKSVTFALEVLNEMVDMVAENFIEAQMNINKVLSAVTFGETSKRFKQEAEIMKEAMDNVRKPNISFSNSSSTNKDTINKPFISTTNGAKEASDAAKDLKDRLADIQKAQEDLGNSAADAFSEFTKSIGSGENALESLRKTALNVLNDIVDNMWKLTFGGTTSGGLGGTIASGLFSMLGINGAGTYAGPASGPPPPKPFAKGGVVNRASVFPIGGNLGQMGEKGPEAIMPLVRGAGGKLGVAASGGDGKNITQNINISTGVQQTVRAEIMRSMPAIAKAAVSAVQDSTNRGILKGVQ